MAQVASDYSLESNVQDSGHSLRQNTWFQPLETETCCVMCVCLMCDVCVWHQKTGRRAQPEQKCIQCTQGINWLHYWLRRPRIGVWNNKNIEILYFMKRYDEKKICSGWLPRTSVRLTKGSKWNGYDQAGHLRTNPGVRYKHWLKSGKAKIL